MGSPNTILARVAVDSGTRDSAQKQKKWEGVTDSSTEDAREHHTAKHHRCDARSGPWAHRTQYARV